MQHALRIALDEARSKLSSARQELISAYNMSMASDHVDDQEISEAIKATGRALSHIDKADITIARVINVDSSPKTD